MRAASALGAALVAIAACSVGSPSDTPLPVAVSAPSVLVADRAVLADARAAAASGHADLAPAIAELRRAADAALAAAPVSVTGKTVAPPSGDAHDYVSLSIYWWPDATKPTGLPYLNRDGVINPEASDALRYDASKLVRMVGTVETLALAGYITGDRRYSDAAAAWLRTWFLDEATRMNPNMKFAQLIPGRTEQRGTGIIESRQFMRAVDGALLLDGTPSWSAADQSALRAWFAQLTDWLTTSAQGQMEGRAVNNHGTWYDAQLVDFALYSGRDQVARDALARVATARVNPQIAQDGTQKLELARTRSYHYSVFNLIAFCILGDLGERAGVDVWRDSSTRLRPGIDLLVRSASGGAPWTYPEMKDVDYAGELAPILVRASRVFPDAGYEKLIAPIIAKLGPLNALKLRLGVFGGLGGTASPPPPWAA